TVVWGELVPRDFNRVGLQFFGASETLTVMPEVTSQLIIRGITISVSTATPLQFLWKDVGDVCQKQWFVSGFNPGASVNVMVSVVPHWAMKKLRELALAIEDTK
ncbi:unnamed protein product, partial [marine sediment metagenome]